MMSDHDQWHLLPEADDDDDEAPNEWIPVAMAAIFAGAVILVCIVCGETVSSVASIIWGKS